MNHCDSNDKDGQRQQCLTFRSFRSRCFVVAFSLLLSVVCSGLANSQTLVSTPRLTQSEIDAASWGDDPWSQSEGDEETEETVEQFLAPLTESVVQVRNPDRLCCLGTVVANGLVVTKRSELSGPLTCITADGSRIAAAIIASDQIDDLALLKMVQPSTTREKLPSAVNFQTAASVESGDILFSVGTDAGPASVGVATVSPQRLSVEQPKCRDCVDLGVTVSAWPERVQLQTAKLGDEWVETQNVSGARVNRVYPRTVGERIGLLQGDLLVSINQQWIPNAATLRAIGSRVRVGQTLDVILVRDGKLKRVTMKIDHFLRRVYHDRWGGGPFSERRFGFGTTIVHDSLLDPKQCGGPLVDVDGNVVGLNIARSMRVATLAVPADRVQQFVARFGRSQFQSGN